LNPEIPHFICLDEMNLARVEYYFADFLSLLESAMKRRKLIYIPLTSLRTYFLS
jgi:5-methylcytosine-specific restriction endonuclease McrBC GTP-binding regulatory subunit McrB